MRRSTRIQRKSIIGSSQSYASADEYATDESSQADQNYKSEKKSKKTLKTPRKDLKNVAETVEEFDEHIKEGDINNVEVVPLTEPKNGKKKKKDTSIVEIGTDDDSQSEIHDIEKLEKKVKSKKKPKTLKKDNTKSPKKYDKHIEEVEDNNATEIVDLVEPKKSSKKKKKAAKMLVEIETQSVSVEDELELVLEIQPKKKRGRPRREDAKSNKQIEETVESNEEKPSSGENTNKVKIRQSKKSHEENPKQDELITETEAEILGQKVHKDLSSSPHKEKEEEEMLVSGYSSSERESKKFSKKQNKRRSKSLKEIASTKPVEQTVSLESKSSEKSIKKQKLNFRFDISKYKTSFGVTNSLNPLLKTSEALQKHLPFKEHIKHFLSSNNGKKEGVDIDYFGLNNIQMSKTVPDECDKLQSSIQTSLDTSNLYFDSTNSQISKQKLANDTEVNKIMQKSVLPDDLEKREKAPKLFESYYQKKKLLKAVRDESAGKGWYNLPKPEITEELKRDLQLIKMRNVLSTKHHYKRNDTNQLPKYFEVGTIVEGAHEFYSTRLPKKQRKRTIVDELLDDADLRRRNKKRLIEIKKKQMSGGKGFYKQKQNNRKPVWARK